MEREFSDLKLDRKECAHCGAIWLNGKHIWSGTGIQKDGSELDLAGLVCNTSHGGGEKCINPCKGKTGGDTWESRLRDLEDGEIVYGDKNDI